MDQDWSKLNPNPGKRTRPLILSKSNPKVPKLPLSAYASADANSSSGNSKPPSSKTTKINQEPSYDKKDVPAPGTPVPENVVRMAGIYLLGPKLGPSPVKSIVQCLARKTLTDDYYLIKILTLRDEGQSESQDDRQGKMLLHTEYSLLSLLKNQKGVIQSHGLFKDYAAEEIANPNGPGFIYTGKVCKRLFLVLDCVTAHQYSEVGSELITLQQYVTKVKKVPEKEALTIFYNIVKVVCELHKRNIVHRDIKLGNIVLNQRTNKVIFTNFCLGTHLGSDRDLLQDQRGSPAYISPDVLLCKPYLGKPSDMWALGVVLYTMLYGQFPFCDTSLAQLFSRIQAANYNIPPDGNTVQVSDSTVFLIQRLLVKDPKHRLLADEVLDQLSSILASYVHVPRFIEDNHVVPQIPLEEKKKKPSGLAKPNSEEASSDPDSPETKEVEPSFKEESGAFCIPLPEFVALNCSSPSRTTNTSIVVSPSTSSDSASITSPNTPNQSQITVQRIGQDARLLAPSEIARYQEFIERSAARVLGSSARSDSQNIVPEPRADRPERSRLRAMASRMPRLANLTSTQTGIDPVRTLSANASINSAFSFTPRSVRDFRATPWSARTRHVVERVERTMIDHDYIMRTPALHLHRATGRANSTAVSGETANIAAANIATANIATANIATANIATANIATANIATANIATANIATANIATGNIATANITPGYNNRSLLISQVQRSISQAQRTISQADRSISQFRRTISQADRSISRAQHAISQADLTDEEDD